MKHWVDDIPVPEGYKVVKFQSLGRFRDVCRVTEPYDNLVYDLPHEPYVLYVSFQHNGRKWSVLRVDDPGIAPWDIYNEYVYSVVMEMIRKEKKKQ